MAGRVRLSPDRAVQCRRTRPTTPEHLWRWVKAHTGIEIAREAVCQGHSAPFDMFAQQVLERPALALWHGPRGGGKSFLSALDTHVASRFDSRHGTRILGGSKAQSEQIYHAIRDAVKQGGGPLGSDADAIAKLLETKALYVNGSTVSILAASPTSVRGPHVASLKLDEVDEIDPAIRDAAMGMAMSLRGRKSSVLMTSTWHKMSGPMSDLIERGRGGAFPVHAFCAFEVLERCPEERSGPDLEKCPECPIVQWCHADRDAHPQGLPKAKRSNGHYAIESLIQKAQSVSRRVFESDYLCLRPKADGVWFARFDESVNVSEAAEIEPDHPVHCAIDCGVWTGAVLFQAFRGPGGERRAKVFGEYLAEDPGAEGAADAILAMIRERAGDAQARGLLRVSVDAAGGSRNPIGQTVLSLYRSRGLVGSSGKMEAWDRYPGSVLDTLALVEALVQSAEGSRSLLIHPRCKHLIAAFLSYRRASAGGVQLEQPADPQHPHEEMIDALRGGLGLEFPKRLDDEPRFRRAPARRVF